MKNRVGPKAVVDFYSFVDAFFPVCGVNDYTDGKYNSDPNVSYEQAQVNQAEYLLDEIRCRSGSKILDIGCGNGRILEAAKKRGAEATGITVAPDEVRKNNARGLKTLLIDYKNIPHEYDGYFDGIIANGSMEHFVQFDEALAGEQDRIYSEMFSIMSRILKPKGRVATTVIHFRLHFDAREIKEGAGTFKRDDLNFLGSRLMYASAAWYPTGGQLIGCSRPYFRNVKREDGTEDYRRTSEEWIRMWKRGALTSPKAWLILASRFIRNPIWTIRSFDNMVVSQFWTAQFRDWHGQGTPTTLFRDTWEKIKFL